MKDAIITLNSDNIDKEHICCAISDKKCSSGYLAKKEWLKNRIDEGYSFKKLNVKHKVFIEYGPAEYAWMPVHAPGYMLINCFWVAGSFKSKGNGKKLLQECINDSKDKNGVIVLSSNKKRPFLADKRFFIKQGFKVCDTADPYFELLLLTIKHDAPLPSFFNSARSASCQNSEGLTVYYTNACPYTDYYVNTELRILSEEAGIPLTIKHIENHSQVQELGVPFSIYSIFYRGKFITHEILSRKKFEKLIIPLL